MARGGYRAGAGRPRGTPNAKLSKTEEKVIKKSAKLENKTPLDYMLAVMNDATADDDRRDKMAIAAAPYVHQRAADQKLGKKEQQLEEAKTVGGLYAPRNAPNKPKLAVDNT